MLLFILLLVFIGIAVALAWFLIAHDHGEREPIGALWIATGLGLIGGIAAGFAEARFLPVKDLAVMSLPMLALTTLGIGIIEEACKFGPLAAWLYRKRYFNEHTDGIIYFALAGLGFGLPENILYTVGMGTSVGTGRILLTPFFHAATTGLVGYFLAKRKLAHKPVWGIAIPLIGVMILHGLYDFGLLSGNSAYAIASLVITLGLSGGLFVLFLKARNLDQDGGLSAVGHNAFCRSCGAPNPKHHLYCVACGKNA